MREDAKFEVASDCDAESTALLCAGEIKGKNAPPKIPKMFLASKCVFNCAYCSCRCSREERDNYCNTPKELAKLSVDAAKRTATAYLSPQQFIKMPITLKNYLPKVFVLCVRNYTIVDLFMPR